MMQSSNGTEKTAQGATPEGTASEGTASAKSFNPWRLLPLLLVAAALVGFFALGLDQYLSFSALKSHRHQLAAWTADNYPLAAITYMAIYAIATMLSVPGAVWLTITGGFLFGLLWGTTLAVSGATVGAVASFLIVRFALADFVRAKAGPAVQRMERGFGDNAFTYLLVLRLVPLFPFWLVNLVPAVLGVPLRTYFLATVIGIIPGAAVYASVGAGVGAVIDGGGEPDLGLIFSPEILTPIIGLSALALIPVIYKSFKARAATGNTSSGDSS